MFLLNAIFFRSPKYYQRIAEKVSLPLQLFIILCRGTIGGFLLYYLTIFLNMGINWEMVSESAWTYLIMFLLGFGLIHVLIWSYIILIPLQMMGYLKPMLDWAMSMILIILALLFYVFSEIASVFKHDSE